MSQRLRAAIVPLGLTPVGSSPVSPTYSAGDISLQMGMSPADAQNQRAPGEGVLRKSAKELARFWSYVDEDGPTPIHRPDLGPCWIWTGGKRGKGYGGFNMPKQGGGYRMVQAHRYAYEVTVARVPAHLVVDHRCLNKPCCNPAHLEVVTNGENLRRGYIDRTTHCKHGHEFTDENTMWSDGSRRCRACWLTLNARQREALALLVDHGEGVMCLGATGLYDGEPWINNSTAKALERRGLALCEGHGEAATVRLAAEASAA